MADNSDWLGACAAKGKTIKKTMNTANALACFRTIVLRLSYLHFSLVRKSPRESTRFACDAVDRQSVSFTMKLKHGKAGQTRLTGSTEARLAKRKIFC